MDTSMRSDSSYANLAAYADSYPLIDLVNDEQFVAEIHARDFQHDSSDDLFLANLLVDKFHDYFEMSSTQRKHATRAIMQQRHTLRQLFEMYETNGGKTPPRPASTDHVVDGLLGPYPAARGRPPVKEETSTAQRRAQSLPPVRGPGEQKLPSPSAPLRFGDLAGIALNQPLTQVVLEAFGSPTGKPENQHTRVLHAYAALN